MIKMGKVDEKLYEMGKIVDNLGEMVDDIQSFHVQIKVQNALLNIFEHFFMKLKNIYIPNSKVLH